MATKKLTAKQAKFVDEYLIDLNATAAAIRAGYSEKTSRFTGYENLTKPDIQAAIKKRQEKEAKERGITPKRVLDALSSIAFADISPDERLRFCDKQKALETLAKHLGLFEADNKQKTDPLVDVLKEIAKRSAPLVSDD